MNSYFWQIKKFLKTAVGGIVVINIILAATALLKDIFLASYLGTSWQADAFLLAYFIPDTAGNNLLAAALGVACVPMFARLYAREGSLRLLRVTAGVTLYFLLVSSVLVIFSYVARESIIDMLGNGLSEDAKALCVRLFVIILPTLLFFPAVSIGISALQVYGRFNIPALAPVVFNLVFLAGVLYSYFSAIPVQRGVYILAFSIMAGVLLMTALTWSAVRLYGGRPAADGPGLAEIAGLGGDIREIFKLFLPYLIILLSTQTVYAVERFLASGLEEGTIAGLNYAFRMAQFPLWVFVAAVSAVAFPSMSRSTGLGRMEEIRETLSKTLQLVVVIALPMSICLFVLRVPLISILLQRGTFDFNSVGITAGILAGYSLAIVFQGVVIISLRAFLSIGRLGGPLLAVLFSSCVNIVLDFFLVGYMGPAGLGYGAAAGAVVCALLMLLLLDSDFGLRLGTRLGFIIRVAAANLPVLLLVILCGRLWLFVSGSGFIMKLGYGLVIAAAGAIIYWKSLKTFGVRPGGLHGRAG